MNIKSWKLPVLTTFKQPISSKTSPPLRSQSQQNKNDDERCFNRGYN